MSVSPPSVGPTAPTAINALKHFVAQSAQRVQLYLQDRPDRDEQADHLRHVADRTRWLYYSELQRKTPGVSMGLTAHEDTLLEACVYSHDIGKWIPRDDLRTLLPADDTALAPIFKKLKFTHHQVDLFVLGVNERFALERDGYVPEYDSAHHLVSAYILATDASLGFGALELPDQIRLINMVVGHQFDSYFRESLMNIRLRAGSKITTGMLSDLTDVSRVEGDLLGCAFHDADISDLLFVGSLERRPMREAIFHPGGLIKILMINFTNRIYNIPHAPSDLAGCVRSCRETVKAVFDELITPTAKARGKVWQRDARRFLSVISYRTAANKLNVLLTDDERPAQERLVAIRSLLRLMARDFLSRDQQEE